MTGTDHFKRCACGAALLGIDPPGDKCRNCAPRIILAKTTREALRPAKKATP